MKRDIHFFTTPKSPKWRIIIDKETVIAGIGNPLTDKSYTDILVKKLTFEEGCDLDAIMEREQFRTKKPVMMILEPDRVFVLKPSYATRQETLGMILQHLTDRAEASLIGNDAEGD